MSLKRDKRDKGDSRDIKTWLAFKPDIQLFVMDSFAMFYSELDEKISLV